MEPVSRADVEIVARQLESWRKGIAFELDFWNYFYASKGGEWPDEYQLRLQPDREIFPYLVRHLPANEIAGARVLDVGSGPISKLGTHYQGVKVSVTAVDPLAPFYDQLAQRFGVTWPIKTVEGFAEDLSAQFPANHFDAVYCSNALDHSMDPMRGIEEMLIVAKIGGNVTLQHNANEALFENYAGFHQWNFDAENGAFVIWNREKRYVVNEWVAAHATIEARRFGEGLSVVMRKTSDLPVDLEDRHRLRVRTLLAAFTLASGSSWTPPTA